MRTGWGAPQRLRRAATALVALTLLPVGVLVASSHAGAPQLSPIAGRAWLAAQDVDQPSVEAFQRSQASNLFAPFTWNGHTALGPFVRFGYNRETGTVEGYSAVKGSSTELLVETLQIVNFTESAAPQLAGATFAASGVGVTFVAHEEPMALLEIETTSAPRSVVLTFPAATANLEVSHATIWPRATLSFTIGDNHGRIILGKGTIAVNGTTATAVLQPGDYLALRAVPAFAEHPAERTAVLDAFGSGRLASEWDLVAMENGGWLENSARYQSNLTTTSTGIGFSQAALTMNASGSRDGLVLMAFDPLTMPVDANHRLVVMNNGAEIPEATDPLASLYAAPGSTGQPSYSQLSMNATVIVVYLPTLVSALLQVQSLDVPSAGLDAATELAMIGAAFIVSVAAAVMFRSRHE